MHKEVVGLVATAKAGLKSDEQHHFETEMKSFERLFKTYMATRNQKIDWSLISPPKEDLILPWATLPKAAHAKDLANKLCVLKLNGGLGTTMGCVGPKSAIEVREGSSFLDLNVKQIKVRHCSCSVFALLDSITCFLQFWRCFWHAPISSMIVQAVYLGTSLDTEIAGNALWTQVNCGHL